MISFRQKGDFSKLTGFLEHAKSAIHLSTLDRYGKEGVAALESATPVDTGKTASSWYYKIVRKDDYVRLQFFNSNQVGHVPVAILLQYGHATGNGGWVEGRDYINPALQPIFDRLAREAFEEVSRT